MRQQLLCVLCLLVCVSFGDPNICTQTTYEVVPIQPNVPFTIPTAPEPLPAYCDLSTYDYSTQQLYTFNATGTLVWCGATFVNHLFGCSDPSLCDYVEYIGDATCGSYSCEVYQVNGTIVGFIATEYVGVVGLFNVNSCPDGTINTTLSTICSQNVSNASPDQVYTTDIPPANFIGGCSGTASPKYSTNSSLVRGHGLGYIVVCPTTPFLGTADISVSVYSCASGFECVSAVDESWCGEDYGCFEAYVFGDFIIQVESSFPSLNWTYGFKQCSAVLDRPSPICNYPFTSELYPNVTYTTDIDPVDFALGCDGLQTYIPASWSSHFNYNATGDIIVCATTIGQDIFVAGYDCSPTMTCNFYSYPVENGYYTCYAVSNEEDPLEGPVHIEVVSLDGSQVEWIFDVGQFPSLPDVNPTFGTMCNNSFMFAAEQNVTYKFNVPPPLVFRECDLSYREFEQVAAYAQIYVEDEIMICSNSNDFEAILYSCTESACSDVAMNELGNVCGDESYCYYGTATGNVVALLTTYAPTNRVWAYSLVGCPPNFMPNETSTGSTTGSTAISTGTETTGAGTTGSTSTSGSTSSSTSTLTSGSTSSSTSSTTTMNGSTTSSTSLSGSTTGSTALSTGTETTTGATTMDDSTSTSGSTTGGNGEGVVASGERVVVGMSLVILLVVMLLA